MNLFKGGVDIPPLFIEQMAHVVLRNILDAGADPLQLRAAELFFREQKATIQDGHALLADLKRSRCTPRARNTAAWGG